MSGRERDISLKVRVTDEENIMIREKMSQLGTTNFNSYAIKMLIDGYVIKHDFKELKGLTYELGKIGTNINQIAKHVNQTNSIYESDMKDLQKMLHEIMKITNKQLSSLIK